MGKTWGSRRNAGRAQGWTAINEIIVAERKRNLKNSVGLEILFNGTRLCVQSTGWYLFNCLQFHNQPNPLQWFLWTGRLLVSLKITFWCWWQLRREKSAITAGRTSEWAETAELDDNYLLNYCYSTHTINPFTQRQHPLIYTLFCLGLLNNRVHLNNTDTYVID